MMKAAIPALLLGCAVAVCQCGTEAPLGLDGVRPAGKQAPVAPRMAAAATAPMLVGTTGAGRVSSVLYEIDPATGAIIQEIGPVGYIVNGMEYDPSTGTLYGSTSVNDPNHNGLITIDLATGAGTPAGADGWGLDNDPEVTFTTAVTNITLDSSGEMYGWWEPECSDLVSIDKTTGIAALVADAGLGTGQGGLDFDSSDVLYLVDGSWGANIYIIDPGTGAADWRGELLPPPAMAHHGDFHPVSNLYYGLSATRGARDLVVADLSALTVTAHIPLSHEFHVITFVWDENGGGTTVEVDLDIKPGDSPNSINLKSNGVVPVAILGKAAYDVQAIDAETVRFGPAQAAPVRAGSLEDVNGDGLADLVLHFRTQDAGLSEDSMEAILTGLMYDGTEIQGTDSVRIVPGSSKGGGRP